MYKVFDPKSHYLIRPLIQAKTQQKHIYSFPSKKASPTKANFRVPMKSKYSQKGLGYPTTGHSRSRRDTPVSLTRGRRVRKWNLQVILPPRPCSAAPACSLVSACRFHYKLCWNKNMARCI